MINGWAAERFGPKQVYLAGMVAMVGAIFITFFANSLGESSTHPAQLGSARLDSGGSTL